MATRSRVRRALLWVAKATGALVLLVAALVGVTLACLNLPVARRTVATRVNALLAAELRGTITIESIGRLGPFGVAGVRARLRDPDGRSIAFADGVAGRLDTVRLVRSLLHGGTIELQISSASVDYVDLSLDADASGQLRLLGAVEPRKSGPAKPPAPDAPPGGVQLRIADATLRHAWTHGRLPGGPPLDVEVRDADASVAIGPTTLEIVERRATIESRGMVEGADPRGNVVGRLELPTGKSIALDARFEGDVGGVRTTASAKVANGRLDAAVTVSTASAPGKGTKPRALVPELWLGAPLTIHATASGPLTILAIRADGTLGNATVNVNGELALTPTLRTTATVHVAHLDLRTVAAGAPASDVSAVAEASFVVVSGEPSGTVRVVTEPSRVGAVTIPKIIASGQLSERQILAHVLTEERAVRAVATLCLRQAHGETLLDFDVSADSTDLRRIPGLFGAVSGVGHARADGTVSLDTKRGDAHVVAHAENVAVSSVRALSGVLDARSSGPMLDPHVDATLAVEHVSVGDLVFRAVSARASGTPMRAAVRVSVFGEGHAPTLDATSQVTIGDVVTLRDVTAVGSRNGERMAVSAERVRIAPGDLRLDGAVVVAAGDTVRATAHVSRDEVRLRLDGRHIDLRRVASIAGLGSRQLHGSVDADVDLVAHRSGAVGRARVELTNAAFGGGSEGEAHLDVKLEQDSIVGGLEGSWSGSTLSMHTDGLRIVGPPTKLASWGRAFGTLSVDADVDLGRLHQALPAGVLPVAVMSGRVKAQAAMTRRTAGGMPEATVSVRTSGFELSPNGETLEPSAGTAVRGPAPWRVSGMDFDLDAATDEDGDAATFHGRVHDVHGEVVDVTLGSRFPPGAVLTDPARLKAFLESEPVKIRVSVPERRIADLPGALGTHNMGGTVLVTASASGTLRAPNVQVAFEVRDFKNQRNGRTPAVGARVVARYDGADGKIDVTGSCRGKDPITATAIGHVAMADLLAKRADAPWEASLRAKVDALPLDSIPELGEQSVRGSVTGDVEASVGTRAAPHFHAKLHASPLSVGKSRNNRAEAELDVSEDTLSATASVQQPDGSIAAKADVGVVWPFLRPRAGIVPPAARPAHLSVQAKAFRLAIARPFLRDVVNRLDGRVDADVQIDVSDHGNTMATRGQVDVHDGVFELPDLGEEFQEVRAKATFAPNGVVTVTDAYAHGTTGSIRGSAAVRMKGLGIASAHADLWIPKGEPLPVSVQGQILADAWGTFHMDATRAADKDQLSIQVELPEGGVKLPDKATHSIQSLAPAPRVRIGTLRSPGQFEVLGEPPTVAKATTAETRVAVHVGSLEVRRGTDLRVVLEGAPVVTVARETTVIGRIVLREGFLEVEGKRFEIESGTITFVGEPDDPEVVVTAGWTAPEGSRVYADFVGPLKTGKVTLRSEPAHSNSEILSLILFGTTSGSSAPLAPGTTSADQGAQTAAGVGGGFATQGLNRALDDVTGLDLTARVDTSDSANPRPELEVRIARDISVSLAHVLGVPPPGANPDRNFATVDWRFVRNWSVQSTFGDAGSSTLDFVWQYRY